MRLPLFQQIKHFVDLCYDLFDLVFHDPIPRLLRAQANYATD
jgi:hypothetical protein